MPINWQQMGSTKIAGGPADTLGGQVTSAPNAATAVLNSLNSNRAATAGKLQTQNQATLSGQTQSNYQPAQTAPRVDPLYSDGAYSVVGSPVPAGDANAYLTASGLDPKRGTPTRVRLPDGTEGYIVSVDGSGRGSFVSDPAKAFTAPRNSFDEGFANQIRTEAAKLNDPFGFGPKSTLRKNILGWLDNFKPGQTLAKSDADYFEGLLNAMDPKGDAAATFRRVVSEGSNLLPGYTLLTDYSPAQAWRNLGLSDYATSLGLVPQQAIDAIGALGGTANLGPGLEDMDLGALMSALTGSPSEGLLGGLSGLLSGAGNASGSGGDVMAAVMAALGNRPNQQGSSRLVFPLTQQPALTSVPLG